METLAIVVAIICYIILAFGSVMLLTYLDAKYWETLEFPSLVIILSLFWPLTWVILGILYIIHIPWHALTKFIMQTWDTVHKNKENKDG